MIPNLVPLLDCLAFLPDELLWHQCSCETNRKDPSSFTEIFPSLNHAYFYHIFLVITENYPARCLLAEHQEHAPHMRKELGNTLCQPPHVNNISIILCSIFFCSGNNSVGFVCDFDRILLVCGLFFFKSQHFVTISNSTFYSPVLSSKPPEGFGRTTFSH